MEAFSDHHMVCKIHKNIKSSLRETIKGRDPRSTSNTILSCAPRSIRPLSPASTLPVSHSLSTFPSVFPVSSQTCLTISLPALSFRAPPVPQWVVLLSRRRWVWATRGGPSSLRRCSEEKKRGRKNKLLFNAVLARCLGWWNLLQKENNNTPQQKSLAHWLTPTSMLWLVNYCSELFKYT